MSLYARPEMKAKGRENFRTVATELTRRDFMKSMALGAAGVGAVGAGVYFGYSNHEFKDNPVRAALIGTGDEGGVLIGEHNPDYLRFVAVCDLRPTNRARIFHGDDPKGTQTEADVVRKGFRRIAAYGPDCHKKIQEFKTIPELLNKKTIDGLGLEAVVIALPLHLHAPVAIQCMKAGLHVLCEKLMAWNIGQCKEMIATATEHDRVLSIGHQRHYSMLYAHATELIQAGTLGDIKYIRALWHRNNAKPKRNANGEIEKNNGQIVIADGWTPDIKPDDRDKLEDHLQQHGYKSMEELVRWRLYNSTGAGLMAELGSHQLDACSIFLRAATKAVRGEDAPAKVYPLAVTGVGGKYFYRDDREIDDHVFVSYEFPGPNYWKDPSRKEVKDRDDIVVVTYSSINTNAFEPYGECVMGTRATMVVEEEREIQLYREQGWDQLGGGSTLTVTTNSGAPVVAASSSSGPAERVAVGGVGAGPTGKVSRGYREEMEHFAYCIRMRDKVDADERPKMTVHCDGPKAMVDAIIALGANRAIREKKRIEFDAKWFDTAARDSVPDDAEYDRKYLKKYPYA